MKQWTTEKPLTALVTRLWLQRGERVNSVPVHQVVTNAPFVLGTEDGVTAVQIGFSQQFGTQLRMCTMPMKLVKT